jgi:hypothetical protein
VEVAVIMAVVEVVKVVEVNINYCGGGGVSLDGGFPIRPTLAG